MAPSLRTLALILATHRALARLGARRTVFDGVRARRGPSTSKVVDVYAVGDRLDRYALALAATEPLRRARDDALKRTVGRRKLFVTRKLLRRNPCEGTAFSASDRTKEACEMYTTTATRVLKSFGFTPSEWNSVSRALASDRNLRNRVLNQAKLYGLASTIETGSLNVDDGAVPKLQIPVPENEDDLVRFCVESTIDNIASMAWGARNVIPHRSASPPWPKRSNSCASSSGRSSSSPSRASTSSRTTRSATPRCCR